MNDWMHDERLLHMDPAKLKLIRAAAKQTNGKSGNNLATVMLALITAANREKIHFTDDEITLVLELIKDGKSEKEQIQIDKTINLTRSLFQKYNSENS